MTNRRINSVVLSERNEEMSFKAYASLYHVSTVYAQKMQNDNNKTVTERLKTMLQTIENSIK